MTLDYATLPDREALKVIKEGFGLEGEQAKLVLAFARGTTTGDLVSGDDTNLSLWDEAKHPRDNKGRFGHGSSPSSVVEKIRATNPDAANDLPGGRHSSGRGDPFMNVLAKQYGFDGKAEVVDTARFEALPGDTFYRGFTEKEHAEAYRSGEYWSGRGVWGNGMYHTKDKNVALASTFPPVPMDVFAPMPASNGAIVRMKLKPDAKITTYDELYPKAIEMKEAGVPQLVDAGRLAGISGYHGYTTEDGSLVLLDRSATYVEGVDYANS